MRAVWRITPRCNDTEDAFQEALLTAWKRWDRIQTHPNPHALILHICINAAHDVLRRKVRRGKVAGGGRHPRRHPGCLSVRPSRSSPVRSRIPRCFGDRTLTEEPGTGNSDACGRGKSPTDDIRRGPGLPGRDRAQNIVARARARLRGLLSHLIPGSPQRGT